MSTVLDATSVVHLEGELDLLTSRGARDAIARAGQKATRVIIDLEAVTFMDASGFSAILEGIRSVNTCGGACELQRPQAAVRRVLDLLGWPA